MRNIRYTYESDFNYLIRCDEPDDINGKFSGFRIYHTNQVTRPLRDWHNITFNEQPYKLKLSKYLIKRYLDNAESFYFIRLSALNAEFGEGPYSQIIELKKIDRSKLNKLKAF